MNKKRITNILNDRFFFLRDYIKDNLPKKYYRDLLKKKISNSDETNQYKLKSEFKREINKFWSNYEEISLLWHEAYITINKCESVYYIPEDVFYKKIEPSLNRHDLSKAYSDKNMYDLIFKEYKMPKTIIRNMNGQYYDQNYQKITAEESIILTQKYASTDKVVLKPSIETGGGKGVKVLEFSQYNNEEIKESIAKLFTSYNKDFIVQENLNQHDLFNEIHKTSLNTLRIVTLQHKEKINIISGIVRMGNNGSSVDNATVGGLTCGFNEKGQLNPFATSHWEHKKYDTHPYSNFEFKNKAIPNIDSIFKMVETAHKKLQYFGIVSWDIAVDKYGEPHLIEINLKLQDINFHQRNNGPLFGQLTESVLERVYFS